MTSSLMGAEPACAGSGMRGHGVTDDGDARRNSMTSSRMGAQPACAGSGVREHGVTDAMRTDFIMKCDVRAIKKVPTSNL